MNNPWVPTLPVLGKGVGEMRGVGQASCSVGGELIRYHEDYMAVAAENEHPAGFGATGHRAQVKLLRGNTRLEEE